MLFEIRGIVQNALMGVGPLRRRLVKLGSTGMNGDLAAAREQLDAYTRHVDVRGKDVLELGPGHTADVLALAKERGAGRCVGLDVERYVDDGASRARGVELELYDGNRMPYADESFDVVWSSDVLEHVRQPERTLAESHRVLRRGGILAAAIDLRDHYFLHIEEKWLSCLKYPAPLWRAIASNRSSYVNRLRASDWRQALGRAGFVVDVFEETESEVLRDLHRRGRVRAHGRSLDAHDAAVFRLEIVATKP
jgi:SAM-dependent methyltransferase